MHGYGAPGREMRMGQVQMGRLVESVIKDNVMAVIEGPVGSGKSDGYGVPAVLSGKRVVISTAKKQLQHQISRKDIPLIGERIGKHVQVALLKGKSNYACRVKAVDVPAESRDSFIAWLLESEYGDLSDYPGKRPFFWNDVTAEDCIGSRCKFASKCGYWKAKQQIKSAQVIVANHHVVAFDLRFGPKKMLGDYNVLIIDEAHQAPDAFRGAYALSVTPYSVKRILRQIDNAGLSTGLEKTLENAWKRMFELIEDQDGEVPKDPFGAEGDDAINLLKDLTAIVKKEMAEAGGIPDGDMEEDDAGSDSGKVDWDVVAKLEMLKKAVERPLAALQEARDPSDNTVIFITTSERNMKSVTVSPISVGPMVGPKLQMVDSVIVTSATIAVNNSFDHIKRQLGLDWKPPATPLPQVPQGPVSPTQAAAMASPVQKAKEIRELILETPFDYNKQAALYTPTHIPLPVGPTGDAQARDRYLSALTTECMRLIRASDGNAFVLFTSSLDLKEVHERMLVEDIDNQIIPQGDDAEAAFREFMKTPRSVIFGLKSFWEGVDVVGEKLRLVIITKLPFPLVSDPVIQARSRQMMQQAAARGISEQTARSSVFQGLQIPQMLTDLRQGAGRLIRSKTDEGLLAILDGRVWTGSNQRAPVTGQASYLGYGKLVVDSIGFSQRTSKFELADAYLRKIRRNAMKKAANG